MPVVVRFEPAHVNFLIAGDERYFLFRSDAQGLLLLKDACPHRGGPLHLGAWETHPAAKLRCPWHGNAIPLRPLERAACPMVLREGQATAVLPSGETAPVFMQRRPILAACGAALAGAATSSTAMKGGGP
ncbi:Rieske 2Fe-2S domain-containing protein [Stigmatella aurantiaca]|uniref:Rieske domain-containing protein n=1 Tax=Stigmatella aurantiaca (strain DW4/3-1) TaxID=378806 RepID=E3FLK9_STIAD|nr:uncharacterized protein STAUR_6516 [Stigmatella aurantiaca DW4/3-1]